MISKIKSIIESDKKDGSYYGFIQALDDKNDYYFTKKDTNNLLLKDVSSGIEVNFNGDEKNNKRIATDISLCNNSLKPTVITYNQYKENILESISNINDINDYNDFEDATYLLIKLLGIHNIYQFERNNQAGKADGLFVLDNLVVMYDCTLQNNFQEFKKEQIGNYINRLKQTTQISMDVVKPDGGIVQKTLNITNKTRQVWVITKRKSREIEDYDGIKIKEISVSDIVNILKNKIKDGSYDTDKLSSSLMLLGS